MIYVVAGNVREFSAYKKARRIRDRDARYVSRSEQLHGLTEAELVLTGNHRKHWDWRNIESAIDCIAIMGRVSVKTDSF